MPESAIQILLVGFFFGVAWSLFQPRYRFVIRIEGGRPRIRKGKVTAAFLDHVADVCREHGIARGWIGGLPQDRRIALRFSRHFPPGSQQRLRNEWSAR